MLQGRGRAARSLAGAVASVFLLVGWGVGPAAAVTSVEVDVPADAPTGATVAGVWYGTSAPRGAEVVHVVLPPSAAGMDPTRHLDHVSVALPGNGESRTEEGITATSTGFDLDLPTIRTALGADPGALYLTVWLARGESPARFMFDAIVEIALTDDVATEATITLADDETASVRTSPSWSLPAAVVDDGQNLVLRASPGFWNDPAAGDVTAVERWWSHIGPYEAAVKVVVSPDGSTATIRIGSTPHDLHEILVSTTFDDRSSRVVLVPVVGPPTPNEAYVIAVYRHLFEREPDSQGLLGWSLALDNGAPRGAVADGITYSAEFRLGLIADSYQQFLGRAPDTAGWYGWLAAMQEGMPIQEMESGFIASPEYYARAGGTNPGWMAALYRDVLGRTPSPAEVSGWLPVIASKGRIDVARQFLYSTEYLTHVVDGYYQWLLGRGIDPTGARDWVRAIQQGVRSEAIIAGIISSQEYRNNVGR